MTAVLRLALAQFDFPVGDIAGNAARITTLITQARDQHRVELTKEGMTMIVVTHEMWFRKTGDRPHHLYGPRHDCC